MQLKVVVETTDGEIAARVRAALGTSAAEVSQAEFPSVTSKIVKERGPQVLFVDCRVGKGTGGAEAALAVSADLICVLVVEDGATIQGPLPFPLASSDAVSVGEIAPGLIRTLERIAARQRLARNARSEVDAYRRRAAELQVELEQMSKQLREVEGQESENARLTAIEQLIVTIRHEINNPLATLVGRAQLLRMRGRNAPEHVVQVLEEIEREALRIRALMDRLDTARDGRTTGYLDRRRIKLD